MITPPGRRARPTSSMVREALFNILGYCVRDASVVDLFSGSGAIGLEALSRGASYVIFVDNDKRSCSIIKQNIDALGFGEKARVLMCDAINTERWGTAFVDRHRSGAAGLVLADPPYDFYGIANLPNIIAGSAVISTLTSLIIEHGLQTEMPETAGALSKFKEKRYGGACLTIYHISNLIPRNANEKQVVEGLSC